MRIAQREALQSSSLWLQGIAENQPITPIIETIRSLLFDLPLGTQPWWALGWCVGILILAGACGAWFFGRKAGRRWAARVTGARDRRA